MVDAFVDPFHLALLFLFLLRGDVHPQKKVTGAVAVAPESD
jgi:hypothetical protein